MERRHIIAPHHYGSVVSHNKPFGRIHQLQDLCLEVIFRDLGRHAHKFHMLTNSVSFFHHKKVSVQTPCGYWHAATTIKSLLQSGIIADKELLNYLKFMQIYRDNISSDVYKHGQGLLSDPEYRYYAGFVYNTFTNKVYIPWLRDSIPEELVANIICNCQDAWYLHICDYRLDSHSIRQLIKSLKNLRHLHFYWCTFPKEHLSKDLFKCFDRLQVLKLESSTSVDDEFIFRLCCEKNCYRTGFLFSCDCPVSSLKLRQIDVSCTRVSPNGISCLLIHIHTLKKITPVSGWGFHLSEVISQISILRVEQGMPSITFQIDELYINGHKQVRSMEMCPNLQTLCVRMGDVDSYCNGNISPFLVRYNLTHVTNLILECHDSQMLCNEVMELFWEKKGPQLKTLVISSMAYTKTLAVSLGILQNILQNCPNLVTLELERVTIPFESSVKEFRLRDTLKLYKLQCLYLYIRDGTERANNTARSIISLAPNITNLKLRFHAMTEVFATFLTREAFPYLENVDFDFIDPDDGFQVFLRIHDFVGRRMHWLGNHDQF